MHLGGELLVGGHRDSSEWLSHRPLDAKGTWSCAVVIVAIPILGDNHSQQSQQTGMTRSSDLALFLRFVSAWFAWSLTMGLVYDL